MKMSAIVVAVAVIAVPRGMHECATWMADSPKFRVLHVLAATVRWWHRHCRRRRCRCHRFCCLFTNDHVHTSTAYAVCLCVSNIWMLCNCLRFIQFHMEYFSFRFCCGRQCRHCRCCSLLFSFDFFFVFISFHFTHMSRFFLSHLIFLASDHAACVFYFIHRQLHIWKQRYGGFSIHTENTNFFCIQHKIGGHN